MVRSALFFQFAERDGYIAEQAALEFDEAGSESKLIERYSARRVFNDQARLDRIEWLSAQLGLAQTTQWTSSNHWVAVTGAYWTRDRLTLSLDPKREPRHMGISAVDIEALESLPQASERTDHG